MQEQPRRPQVTLVASSAPVRSTELRAPSDTDRRARALLLASLVLLAGGLARQADPVPVDPPVPAELVLLDEQLLVTQAGVLVVGLEVRNPGPQLQVASAVAYAQPVHDDPVVQAPEVVRATTARHFVTLLAPDCRVLQPGSPLRFSASVLMTVRRGSVEQELVVDLTTPALRDRVASLCGSA